MSISADYQKNLDTAARDALMRVVAARPNTTVAELRELMAQFPPVGRVTLADLAGQTPKRAPVRAAKPASQQRPAIKTAPKARNSWDTRTDVGRDALDRAVYEGLAALGGESVSAEALRARLGASPAQLRASLNRHITSGDVSFSGKARGTRYTVEG